ncbi:MAG: serine/threonine protein phosphatase [Deltaproteobacteria bacterium]|nr:serine/threonine protein phosphatase [Deltaproteobacteria bacterium]
MSSFVVGDIHGCLAELRYLIEQLPLRHGDQVIFLGDYIDRGPDSKGVVSFLLELRNAGNIEIVCLKGNHEDMLLGYLGFAGNHGNVFLSNGGQATLASYGISTATFRAGEITKQFPESHLSFYQNLATFYVLEPYLCVHAGIQPLKKLDEQIEADMFWIRNEFIRNPHNLPLTVLFGHTPHKEVLFDLPYKIGLDTGLVYGNKLTCLALEDKVIYQIRRGAKTVQQTFISDKWNRKFKFRAP